MAALARNPGPKQPASAWMPSSGAMGPLTMTTWFAPPVVAAVPARLKGSRRAVLTALTTTGKCSGPAAGHDGVDGELFQRGAGVAGLEDAEGVLGVGVDGGEHGADGFLGGRDDGEAVGPALLPEVVLHVGEGLGDAHAGGGEVGGGHGRLLITVGRGVSSAS